MLKLSKCLLFFFIVGMLGFMSVSAEIQEVDKDKLYAEMSGTFEFDVLGEIRTIQFWAEDGIMQGQADVDNEVVELDPVEGNPMAFETTDDSGDFYEIEFKRDEGEKITICIVTVAGMELEGIRIK
ncbi:hypothetical protein ACFLT9_08345 [Acidobacteriota bacterium]